MEREDLSALLCNAKHHGRSSEAVASIVSWSETAVKGFARSLRNLGMDRDDLEQEGYVGVLVAISAWKPGVGDPESYLMSKIRFAMRRAIADRSRIIRIPEKAMRDMIKVNAVARTISERWGRVVVADEAMDEMGVSGKRRNRIVRAMASSTLSGDTGTLTDGSESVLDSLVEAGREDEASQKWTKLAVAIASLAPEKRKVFRLYYGISGQGGGAMTTRKRNLSGVGSVAVVAKLVGKSGSEVSSLLMIARRTLRNRFKKSAS